MPRSRTDATDGHVLIGGTGRAGTTLLVQYFSALGFDTGFTLDRALAQVNEVSHAGLEHSLKRTLKQGRPLPYVAKSPYFGANLADYLGDGSLTIRGFVIPMRDLGDAASSRRRVSRLAAEGGGGRQRHPGGLLNPRRTGVGQQEKSLAVGLHELLHTLAVHAVPVHLLPFPHFAEDPARVFEHLEPLLAEHGVSARESREAMASVARTELIHRFDTPEKTAPDDPTAPPG